MVLRGSLFILIISVLVSCKKKQENHTIQNDGLIRQKLYRLENVGWKSKTQIESIDDIKFTATQVPLEYYLLKDKGNQDLFLIDSLYKENNRERIFEFTFEHEGEEDLLQNKFTNITYEEGIKYMSFLMNNDFYVVTSKNDTIFCSGVNFERNYKIAPYHKIMLFFSGIPENDEIQLIYKDKLFKKGTIKFQFKDTYTEILL